MKVSCIMRAAAELAGRRDLADFIAGEGGTDADALGRDAALLLRCYNLTEDEAALDYVPLIRCEKVLSQGKIPFAALSSRPLEILSVFSPEGKKLPFRAEADGIAVRCGEAEIVYRCRPFVKGEEDEAELAGGERFLSLGTACEFALMEGAFDRAAELDARYKDALRAACRQKGAHMKGRRWI